MDISKTENKSLKVLMIAPTPFFADRGCHVKILEEIKTLSKRNIKIIITTVTINN